MSTPYSGDLLTAGCQRLDCPVAEWDIHHVPAREWFAGQPDASVTLCRIRQMGLKPSLRLWTFLPNYEWSRWAGLKLKRLGVSEKSTGTYQGPENGDLPRP